MTEKDIISGLLSRDETVTREFFFGNGTDSCKGMLTNVLKAVYKVPVVSGRFSINKRHVVYEDAASAFYLHLLSQDGRRLKEYDVSRGRLYGYLRTCAVFFFMDEQEREARREGTWKEPSMEEPPEAAEAIIEMKPSLAFTVPTEKEASPYLEIVEKALESLPSPRGRAVLRRVWLNGEEAKAVAEDLGITLTNLYNIRSRCWREYVRIATRLVKEGDIKYE